MAALADRDPGDETTVAQRDDAVVEWRYRQALRLGYSDSVARMIAYGRVDIHELRDLRRRGCPPYLALRIAE